MRIHPACLFGGGERLPRVGHASRQPTGRERKNENHREQPDAGNADQQTRQGASPLRVVYAFDPHRDAVLLIGGDKGSDARFYERIIRRAERIWKEYLDEQAKGLHEEKP